MDDAPENYAYLWIFMVGMTFNFVGPCNFGTTRINGEGGGLPVIGPATMNPARPARGSKITWAKAWNSRLVPKYWLVGGFNPSEKY